MAFQCSALILLSNSEDKKIEGYAKKNGLKSKSDAAACNVADHQKMLDFLGSRQKIGVFDSITGQNYTRLTKNDILDAIDKFTMQPKKSRFVIYYSGLGADGSANDTKCGDWILDRNDTTGERVTIGIIDILKIWDSMRQAVGSDSFNYDDRDLLFIIADCCHSGGWVDYLRETRALKEDPSGKTYRDVHIIASCRKDERCDATDRGSVFTDHYVNSDSSTHNLTDTVQHKAKLVAQSTFQAATFPLYMPIKGIFNLYNSQKKYRFHPVATNDHSEYRIFLMKHDGIKLPIGNGLGLNSGWSWMLSGQVFHN